MKLYHQIIIVGKGKSSDYYKLLELQKMGLPTDPPELLSEEKKIREITNRIGEPWNGSELLFKIMLLKNKISKTTEPEKMINHARQQLILLKQAVAQVIK
jgi:hypothetical protein